MAEPPFPFRLVSFDIDGTLVAGHGWERVARTAGREAEYRETNRRFRAGEEGEDAHLKRLLDLAVGLSIGQMEEVVAATPKVDGIPESIDALHARGVRVALLTHNPEYVVAWYRRHYGFDDAEGTTGTVVRRGVIVESGPATADKIGGMRRLLDRAHLAPVDAAHVGDGTADAAVFRRVGGGVAFNPEDPRVGADADRVVRSHDLRDVLPALASITPRRG